MVGIILLMIGLFMTSVDIIIPTGVMYPLYEKSENIGTYIQDYVINHILTDRVRIDIFPDILGCILILIGSIILFKYSKKYFKAYLFLALLAVSSVALRAMPFFLNGEVLIEATLVIYVMILVFELLTEYIILYTTSDISDARVNKGTNTRMKFGWMVTVFCRVFILLLTFVGLTTIVRGYQVVLIFFTIFYLYQLFSARKYLGKTGL